MSTYTPEKQQTIKEYLSAVDDGLIAFVEEAERNRGLNQDIYSFMPLSDRAVQDIRAAIGVDATGFAVKIEARLARHLVKRHGPTGEANHSMADVNDVGRIQYVLDTYDNIYDGGYTAAYKEPKFNAGRNYNKLARTVVYEKK